MSAIVSERYGPLESLHKSYPPSGKTAGRMVPGVSTDIRSRVGIDARALAVFRMGVGLLLFVDLCLRVRDLRVFYTDSGVFPRTVHAELFPRFSELSVHALSGSIFWQAGLFVLAGVLAGLLIVGYRTRGVAAASWVLLASLQMRNYHVLNGGDTVLLVLLFIGLFLPLGRRWSLDALCRERTDDGSFPSSPVCGFGTAAILSQVVLIYVTNAVFKLRGETWLAGEAVPQVFEVERFTVLLGPAVADASTLLVAGNWLWLTMLVGAPLLFVTTGWIRAILVGAYVVAHLGMALTMELGLFPGSMVVGLVLFVPPVVWDRLETPLGPAEDRLTALLNERPEIMAMIRPAVSLTPASLRRVGRRVLPIATGTILIVGLVWQAAAIGVVPMPDDGPVDPEDHSWKLFAPEPPGTDGWYAAPATLESGATVDLYPHAEAGFDRPPDIADTYPNTRWRKFLFEVRYGGDRLVESFAGYLCDRGHDRYGEAVESIEVYFIEEPVDTDSPENRSRIELGSYRCGDLSS